MERVNFDYSNLIKRINYKYDNQRKFASDLGISNFSLILRLTNQMGFSESEILKSCILLDIPFKSMKRYFFIEKVHKTELRVISKSNLRIRN